MSASAVGPDSRPPTGPELYAAARIIGNKCFDENLDFMRCKSTKGAEPSACTGEGEAVHKCVYGLHKDISGKAAKEFSALASCLDGADLRVPMCKAKQTAFEEAYYAAA